MPLLYPAVPKSGWTARRLFAALPHSGLSDGHIVNGIPGLATIAQNSVGVLRALLPLAARRGGLATGGAALVLLALLGALAALPSPAAARGEDWRSGGPGGSPDRDRRGPGWDRWGGSRASDPLAWVRYSRDSFQTVMRKLARRSAGEPPQSAPQPESDRQSDRQSDWPSGPPGGPGPDGPWPPEGRTAEPGRDRTRVKEWHRTRSPSCRRAGVPAEGAGWYVVAPGDTLWRIAWVHYGNGRAWRRILRANWEAIRDPNVIYACPRLFIPRWRAERPPCNDPDASPLRRVCHRPPPQPERAGPGGCSRCGAGSNAGVWGWR